jgi:hypothetical protein
MLQNLVTSFIVIRFKYIVIFEARRMPCFYCIIKSPITNVVMLITNTTGVRLDSLYECNFCAHLFLFNVYIY